MKRWPGCGEVGLPWLLAGVLRVMDWWERWGARRGAVERQRSMDGQMTAKVLRRAAEHVEMGWCQNHLFEDGRACLLGAVISALRDIYGGIPELDPTLDALAVVLPEGMTPAYWNDMLGRTADQVIAKLRQAAVHAEGVRPE